MIPLEEHPQRIVFLHEAAHAILAVHFLVRCDCIRLKAKELGNGFRWAAAARFGPSLYGIEPGDWAQIAFAGWAVERLNGVSDQESQQSCSGDEQGLIEDLMRWPTTVDHTPARSEVIKMVSAYREESISNAMGLLASNPIHEALKALAQVLCEQYQADVTFVHADEIYGVIQRYWNLDPKFFSEIPADACE